ncbi:proline--tRNA ligase [Sulfuracidifex tepidarius]|uniref:Proline--tRNA ligase n=1 Tax=Sulfuracidifex tepidarius TaxID=1294262 RepID=A0A510E2L4_9CREN|nr:proline--tRNA ligase [Sulfuracidifex tepidarius]BBG26746.1 Proline--tRNA ligase [Sulfuracidifex tepidarius]
MKVTREKWSKNFSEWFDRVLAEGEFYDYGRYPVKGVGVWMPYGFRLRQNVVSLIRRMLDSTGHEEILLPLLIPQELLSRETQHIKGFESEVFWVTKGGSQELDVKVSLRPTSEVAITYMESLWLNSYKQLPKKYYQIVSVFRYETKATRPMIRLREITTFKEAHTVHETYEDAQKQVEEAISIYSKFFDELGIPYLLSERPEWDRFAGALHTYAFDTLMPDGKVIQIGTAHHLGQNFTKALDFKVQRRDGSLCHPHQTSYGISDRVVAVIISMNGDDHGPIISPKVAPIKVVVVPIPSKDDEEVTKRVFEYSKKVGDMLRESGIESVVDLDPEKTPGEKYYVWELKGVPLRAEVGPKELEKNSIFLKRRDTFQGKSVPLEDVIEAVKETLNSMFLDLRKNAESFLLNNVKYEKDPDKAKSLLSSGGIIEIPWCGDNTCGMKLEEITDARVLGYPLQDRKVNDPCAICGKPAKTVLRVAKTY